MILQGKKMQTVPSIPAGNTICISGIDSFISKQGTIMTNDEAHQIRSMKFSVAPVVRMALRAKRP